MSDCVCMCARLSVNVARNVAACATDVLARHPQVRAHDDDNAPLESRLAEQDVVFVRLVHVTSMMHCLPGRCLPAAARFETHQSRNGNGGRDRHSERERERERERGRGGEREREANNLAQVIGPTEISAASSVIAVATCCYKNNKRTTTAAAAAVLAQQSTDTVAIQVLLLAVAN